MTGIDDLNREIQALRERISALSAASLRVGSSLDLGTVLREIAESARALTAARYAVITTVGDEGDLEDVVMSGFTPEEEGLVRAWDDSMKVFDALRDLPTPLRVADMPAYVSALGFSADGVIINTFQGTPMRHRDVQIGNFFLGEKEGGREFTDEDEELLVLFASQAAAAIANARTYRAEQRARADLEALVETSPYGVLVFHMPTGHPVSVNREARRLMEDLRGPGPVGRAGDAGPDLPLRRRPRDCPRPNSARERAERRADGARRGGRALRPRRAERDRAGQRDAHPLLRTGPSSRWSSPCRTSPPCKSWSASAPSSSTW